jgi:hypothetical protein
MASRPQQSSASVTLAFSPFPEVTTSGWENKGDVDHGDTKVEALILAATAFALKQAATSIAAPYGARWRG